MIYKRLKLDGMQMQITCAHCKKPKADNEIKSYVIWLLCN